MRAAVNVFVMLAMANSSSGVAARPWGPATPAAPAQVPSSVMTAAIASGAPRFTAVSSTACMAPALAVSKATVGRSPNRTKGAGEGEADARTDGGAEDDAMVAAVDGDDASPGGETTAPAQPPATTDAASPRPLNSVTVRWIRRFITIPLPGRTTRSTPRASR